VRRELVVAPDSKVILRVGRLARSKDNGVLLRALAACDGVAHLVFVGEGEEQAALTAQSAELGLSHRVTFAGYRRDISTLLAISDVLVICSAKEGLPIVLLEAMAAQVPVVSTAVGGIPRVLGDESGWLIPPGDADALKEALSEALSDPRLALNRAEAAHRIYQRSFSREAMGARYLAIYRRLLEGAP